MGVIRKRLSAGAKAKVALDALRGDRTLSEVARAHQVHPTQVGEWRKQLVQNSSQLFERPGRAQPDEALTERLYQQIGELQVKLEWVKKKSGYLD
jgi:transposase-like protein